MKIEKAGVLLDIQELAIFNRPEIKRYLDAFDCCLDWICINPPGTCVVDVRFGSGSSKIDVRFFTLDSDLSCSLVPRTDQIYKLLTNPRSKDIYFALSRTWLGAKKKELHLSIDWRAQKPGGMPSVPLENVVDLSALGLKLCDRFYIMERQ
jgi:hypothetical protein